MIKIQIGTLMFLLIAAAGCGASSDSSSQPQTKSYEYNENDCPTGKQTVTGSSDADLKANYCGRLKDDTANKGCAYDLRRQDFDANCSGLTW